MGINQEDIKLETEPEKGTVDPAAAAAAYEKQAQAAENAGEGMAGEATVEEAPAESETDKLKAELAFRYMELVKQVTWRQCHKLNFSDIPCTDDKPSRCRGVPYPVYHVLQLVDAFAEIIAPRSPLMPIYRTEVAVSVRPFVPYMHAFTLEVADIGAAGNEPKQFVDY